MPTLTLPSLLTESAYQHYVYSYPHKTTYRPFPNQSLSDVWASENLSSLFLYIHIPFCEMRCGFCNLFTTVTHNDDFVTQYVQAVKRQAQQIKQSVGNMQVSRFALGGGTPTQLPVSGLESIFDIAEASIGAPLGNIPMSVEVSPETATADKLKVLRDRGTTRISMGVQSFIDSEVLATQRRQTAEQVRGAIARIRQADFPILNLDLIYGLPEQTVESWLTSIRIALAHQPEEIFLYPLYVRPLTGLGLSDKAWDDRRLACYRAGRALLLASGYEQVSMRMFRAPHYPTMSGPHYTFQNDGMVGLGCGARSYTRSLHYSYDYAVKSKAIKSILETYIANTHQDFNVVNYGFELNREEQQRRFILLSLLADQGVAFQGIDRAVYRDRFQSDVTQDFPILQDLQKLGLLKEQQQHIYLTPLGLERADAIGGHLFSKNVHQLMQHYTLK
ncbi:MAG: STM4012 family radical SAM protein [Cyanobacteria bacterium J06555_13]